MRLKFWEMTSCQAKGENRKAANNQEVEWFAIHRNGKGSIFLSVRVGFRELMSPPNKFSWQEFGRVPLSVPAGYTSIHARSKLRVTSVNF